MQKSWNSFCPTEVIFVTEEPWQSCSSPFSKKLCAIWFIWSRESNKPFQTPNSSCVCVSMCVPILFSSASYKKEGKTEAAIYCNYTAEYDSGWVISFITGIYYN